MASQILRQCLHSANCSLLLTQAVEGGDFMIVRSNKGQNTNVKLLTILLRATGMRNVFWWHIGGI